MGFSADRSDHPADFTNELRIRVGGFGIWDLGMMIPEDAVCCVPAGQRIIQEWTDEPLAAKSEMRTEHTIPISIRVIADALTFIVLGPVSVICCKEDQLIPL